MFPQGRAIGEGLWRDHRKDAGVDSDIGDGRAAAMNAAGQQQMARLAAEECDGAGCVYRGAANLAAGAVDAGRNIHGEDRLLGSPRPFIETQNRGFGGSVEIAGQARAKQRVDRKTGGVEIDVLDAVNIACPVLGGERRVAL